MSYILNETVLDIIKREFPREKRFHEPLWNYQILSPISLDDLGIVTVRIKFTEDGIWLSQDFRLIPVS